MPEETAAATVTLRLEHDRFGLTRRPSMSIASLTPLSLRAQRSNLHGRGGCFVAPLLAMTSAADRAST
jgi:hypothetical protein